MLMNYIKEKIFKKFKKQGSRRRINDDIQTKKL